MLNKRLDHLFWLCMANEASVAEREELMLLMAEKADEAQVKDLYRKAWEDFNFQGSVFTDEQSNRILESALNSPEVDKHTARHLWPVKISWKTFTVAASVVFLLVSGVYFYRYNNKPKQPVLVQNPISKNKIVPGSNKAILTLADGTKIALDDSSNGVIARQTGIKISKTQSGKLVYTIAKADSATSVYNTITTPRGGEYEINLADGSKVWLNSSSSIHFPTVFKGNERKVEVTGEAYFEIAKNRLMPFRVISKNQIVEVLGTHFNINAYADEQDTKTTLIEGSVKVSGASGNTVTLKPSQQAVIKSDKLSIKISEVDPDDAVAWKNGNFMFTNENIESVMRKISRWYDVEIVFSGSPTKKTIWGSVSRFKNVTDVLNMIELTGCAHFKVEERRVIVMP